MPDNEKELQANVIKFLNMIANGFSLQIELRKHLCTGKLKEIIDMQEVLKLE